MSSPRYTCIESTDMISPRRRSANARATADFPTPVGPARKSGGKAGIEADSVSNLGRVLRGDVLGGPPPLLLPGQQKEQPNPGANRAVGHVKRGKADLSPAAALDIKIEKVDDMLPLRMQPIDQVAKNASEKQPERQLTPNRSRVKMMAAEE